MRAYDGRTCQTPAIETDMMTDIDTGGTINPTKKHPSPPSTKDGHVLINNSATDCARSGIFCHHFRKMCTCCNDGVLLFCRGMMFKDKVVLKQPVSTQAEHTICKVNSSFLSCGPSARRAINRQINSRRLPPKS